MNALERSVRDSALLSRHDDAFERRARAGLIPLFAVSGGSKLAGMELQKRMFREWGYPDWFLAAVGVAEVGGACLLASDRTRGVGALGLSGLMLGAVVTHLRRGQHLASLPAASALALCAALAWRRWRREGRDLPGDPEPRVQDLPPTRRPAPAGGGRR